MKAEDVKNIKEGVSNAIKHVLNSSDPDVEALAGLRMSVCNTCNLRKGPRCSKCGCILKFKTRAVNAHCPVNKW